MNDDGTDEEFLVEPIERASVLTALTEGPVRRRELESDLSVSKTTLHRIVTGFREHGLVEETDGELSLTSLGRIAADEVSDYVERMGTARQIEPFLNNVSLDATEYDIDVVLFRDATVTLPKPGQPQRPVRRVMDLVEAAEDLRGFGPVLLPIYVEVFHREIRAGMETELLLAPNVFEGLTAEYPEKFSESAETGLLEVSLHDDLPFGLVLGDDKIALLGYDDEGVLRILIEDDSEELVAWGEDVYETYRRRAESVPVEEF
jgi:predicted transcriptional regulator